ncbi:helicase C-terminal domain-containing protein [Moorena sp. SIO3H5]|uniref:helicase C-terminal domain-containing protein n=1 Tax=Moorena sp. SIO3H5 TaxID=2607834 RepID=UPI0013B88261|nr:ATP-dependent DNA helicase [Moorena sp. SIO3H5]
MLIAQFNEAKPLNASLIEVKVHSSLRDFLRSQGQPNWPHQLTMARLVARALRLGRSALIQTGLEPLQETSLQSSYRLSYLAPALVWSGPVIVVAPLWIQEWLLQKEIPLLQQWFGTDKVIHTSDRFPDQPFQGLLITSPESWLTDRLKHKGWFPNHIPTVIDGVDDLESWTSNQLKGCIQPQDWDALMQAHPQEADLIRDVRVRLTKALFQRPANPYECYVIEADQQDGLEQLFDRLSSLSTEAQSLYRLKSWEQFCHFWQQSGQLMWATVARSQGQFSLYSAPVEVATALNPIWSRQPVVLIGGALDLEKSASVYRQQLGLGELTCLKFSPHRQIQLYLPDRLPMPNTERFQNALTQEIRTLLNLSTDITRPVVILVGDVPLKAQLGAVLAAEFGSRVQVETTSLSHRSILICGWEFWHRYQAQIPSPQLLMIATLPIPSLENPLVAGRVAYYKQQRQDWFRLYLLPTALRELQRAVAPVRATQGCVAILDNRVNRRSYGRHVLSALSPFARINYLDASWFNSDSLEGQDTWL